MSTKTKMVVDMDTKTTGESQKSHKQRLAIQRQSSHQLIKYQGANLEKQNYLDANRQQQWQKQQQQNKTADERPETRLERLAERVPGLGIIMSLCASVFLGTAGMLVKLTTSVHGIEVAVLRASIQFLIYAALIRGRGLRWLPERGEFGPVATRALIGGLSITLSYSALKLIPLGDATTIRFSLPIWTLIMSYFFLRESCGSFKIIAVVISVSGVLLVTKPDLCLILIHRLLNLVRLESSAELSQHELVYEQSRFSELANLGGSLVEDAPLSAGDLANNQTQQAPMLTFSPDPVRQFQGCMMALGASIALSVAVIALRMAKRTPAEVTIFWLSLSSMTIGGLTLLALDKWSVPDNLLDWVYILLNGLLGSLGQWFMTSSLKIEQSGVIALARTADIEVAFLYSALLLGEPIRATSILGSILVTLGVVSVVLPKWFGCAGGGDDDDERAHPLEASSTDSMSSCSSGSGQNQLTTTTAVHVGGQDRK